MPYTDEQLDDGRGVLRLWTGVVAANDVIAATADYLTREDWTKLEYLIADFHTPSEDGVKSDVPPTIGTQAV
jgi:hypothetical protein